MLLSIIKCLLLCGTGRYNIKGLECSEFTDTKLELLGDGEGRSTVTTVFKAQGQEGIQTNTPVEVAGGRELNDAITCAAAPSEEGGALLVVSTVHEGEAAASDVDGDVEDDEVEGVGDLGWCFEAFDTDVGEFGGAVDAGIEGGFVFETLVDVEDFEEGGDVNERKISHGDEESNW